MQIILQLYLRLVWARVAVAMYDHEAGIGGLAHIMLPKGSNKKEKARPALYARSGIPLLLSKSSPPFKAGMIYFSPDLQQRVLLNFINSLNPGGYLILGKSESIPSDLEEYFILKNSKDKIYKFRDQG